jgi:putative membrane protein
MGAADLVPGVSGGTIAFITVIHDELLYSLNSIDRESLRLLAKLRIREFWTKINGGFLATLFAGILTSLLFLAKTITHLLGHHAILTWSFFFGLILISAPLVLRQIRKWNLALVMIFLLGAGITYSLTLISPSQLPEGFFFIFLAGAMAICGLILPGISGSFILLIIGKYQYLINSLISLNVTLILAFIAGCVIGLLIFSRILRWMLHNYRSASIALLCGLMLGSLNKVWPWREVLEYVTNSKGEQVPAFDKSILPWHYFATTGKDPQVFQAILMMALSVFLVVLIEKIAVRLKTKI